MVNEGQLILSDLKSVRWAQEQKPMMSAYHSITDRFTSLKQVFLLGILVVILEIIVVWWMTFLQNLPWPKFVLKSVDWMDTNAVYLLEAAQLRLEWWWDIAGVRLMWLRESFENFLDRNLTTIDYYLAIIQDFLTPIFTLILRPVRAIGNTVSGFWSGQQTQSKKAMGVVQNKNGSIRRHSEGYEAEDNEDWGDEDYLSDASMDSRRLNKENSRGEMYLRRHTTAMAEGKFREAMYHRVRQELGVMRKNSIRFSKGLVNCVRQMVEPRTRWAGESFLEFCQRWAKELGILDLLWTIQEEMRGRPFLVKPLFLVRVLVEHWLAFLLRLVKGKKSRRTRSMRSESLRRRVLNPSGTSNPLQLSPAALQQSSEPARHHPLPAPPNLRQEALKEEEEDLQGFLSKDSALGSEDNRSVGTPDTDQTISPAADEGLESDSDTERRNWTTSSSETCDGILKQRRLSLPSSLCSGAQNSIQNSSLCTGTYNSASLCQGSGSSRFSSSLRNPSILMPSRTSHSQTSHSKNTKSSKQKRVTIR